MHNETSHHPEPAACPSHPPRLYALPLASSLPYMLSRTSVRYQISPWPILLDWPGCALSLLLVKINRILAEPRTIIKLCL